MIFLAHFYFVRKMRYYVICIANILCQYFGYDVAKKNFFFSSIEVFFISFPTFFLPIHIFYYFLLFLLKMASISIVSEKIDVSSMIKHRKSVLLLRKDRYLLSCSSMDIKDFIVLISLLSYFISSLPLVSHHF